MHSKDNPNIESLWLRKQNINSIVIVLHKSPVLNGELVIQSKVIIPCER